MTKHLTFYMLILLKMQADIHQRYLIYHEIAPCPVPTRQKHATYLIQMLTIDMRIVAFAKPGFFSRIRLMKKNVWNWSSANIHVQILRARDIDCVTFCRWSVACDLAERCGVAPTWKRTSACQISFVRET